jgi:hypothetical protein
MGKAYYDFVIYYTGAEIVNAGKGKDLYDLNVQQAYQERFKFPNQPWPVLPFNHAPYELLPFLPLAQLSFQSAHVIWSLISILFLLLACTILLPLTTPGHRILFGALLLSFYPTVMGIKMGQDSAMSLLILVGVFASLKYRRDVAAGSILALGLYKPQLVLPLTGFLLVSRNWRSLLGFSAAGACLTAISLVIVGWQGAVGLLSIISDMDRPTSIVYPQMMTNLRGLFFPLLSFFQLPELTNTLTGGASLIVYGYCLILWKNNPRPEGPLFDLQFSLAVVATVLISYHLYTHDTTILTVPIILTLNYVFTYKGLLTGACKLLLVVAIVLYLPLVPFILEITATFGSLVAPILILYGFLIFEIGSCRSSNPRPLST